MTARPQAFTHVFAPVLTHVFARVFHDPRPLRIGIFGGSFNPAHSGHGHIADLAVRHLRLDELWWLVSPQNPLKTETGMAPYDERFQSALTMARQCRAARQMRVSGLEASLGTNQSAHTLGMIRQRAPRAKLAWIMGADNLIGFHRWYRPESIAAISAITVINRPGCRSAALAGIGAKLAGRRLSPRRLQQGLRPRHWCFIQGPLNHLSATAIRMQQNSH